MFIFRLLLISLVLLAPQIRAANVIDLESAYLGGNANGGLFEYRLKVRTNAFVPLFTAQNLSLGFTNRFAYESTPPSWITGISDFGANGAAWDFTGLVDAGNGVGATFQVRSTQANFRQGSVRLVFSYSLNSRLTGVFPPNIEAAYLSFAALVPCTAAEVDGSPTNKTAGLEFVPDITIQSINRTAGNVSGLTYVWNHLDATMNIEASSDLKIWTVADRIYNPSGTNTWVSPTQLAAPSSFFRVSLVGAGFVPIPEVAGVAGHRETLAPVPGVQCATTADGFRVTVPTVSGGRYRILLTDQVGHNLRTHEFIGGGEAESVAFNDAGLPGLVLIKVGRLD